MSNQSLHAVVDEIVALSQQPSDGANDDERRNKAIVAKATELISTIQSPMDRSISLLAAIVEPAVIRTLLSLKVLQAIPGLPSSISLTELAEATGVQTSLLSRLLRMVVSTGFIKQFEQTGGTLSYSHSPMSQAYGESPLGTVFTSIYDELLTTTALPEYFKTHEACEPDGDDATTRNPQTWYYGCEGQMTAFELLEKSPERLKNFHILSGMVEAIRPRTGFYDFGKLALGAGTRPVFVDIGGGDGMQIGKVLEAHPDIAPEQCILQDRQAVIDLAKQRQLDSTLAKGVELQSHDFFTPQPVKGAMAYHFRAIMHDWSDSVVVKLLTNVVSAMAPDSKVLIGECVLADQGVDGMAGIFDLLMLSIGGKERTRKDFEHVLDRAGLRIEGVYPAGKDGEYSGWSVIEAVLK